MPAIATFNVCNLGEDAPSERLARLGAIIAVDLGGPDIVALQEIMTASPTLATGPVPADGTYQALIAAISAADGPRYAFREIPPLANQDGGMVGANIRVGLLFDPARVAFSDRGDAGPEDGVGIRYANRQPSLTLNPGRIAPKHPAFARDDHHHWAPSRKTLAAEFVIGGRPLFVMICHLKSMRSSSRREEDYAKKQRHVQAEIIHHFAADLLACDPQAAIVLLGDMNDVPGSKTLKLLKGEQFHNLMDDLPREQCHTRWHGNQPQALDHILISPALRRGAVVRIIHLARKVHQSPPELVSDHDPVLVELPALENSANT